MSASWQPLIVMVAPNGARRGKADHPALPITPEEIAATARDCLAAGAAALHLHVRDDEGGHSLDVGRYTDAIAAVREAVGDGLLIQATSESAGRYEPAAQMAMVRALRPEAVSLAIREIVPDDRAATHREARAFLEWLEESGIIPQYILYSDDDLRRLYDLVDQGVVPGRRHWLMFVLGRYNVSQQSDPLELLPFLAALAAAGERAADAIWSVCGFGRREHAIAVATAAFGGHVRVGFENNFETKDGRRAADNATLVADVAAAARALGRDLADGEQARAILRGFADPARGDPATTRGSA